MELVTFSVIRPPLISSASPSPGKNTLARSTNSSFKHWFSGLVMRKSSRFCELKQKLSAGSSNSRTPHFERGCDGATGDRAGSRTPYIGHQNGGSQSVFSGRGLVVGH